MIRNDIFGALKNALERGESIEEAKLSLINAGYSREDVEETASALISEGGEAEAVLPPVEAKQPPSQYMPGVPIPSPATKENIFSKIISKVKGDKTLIILIGVFLVMAIGLGVTFFLMKG